MADTNAPPEVELTALWALVSTASALSFIASSTLATALLRQGVATRADALLLVLVVVDASSSFSSAFGRAFVPSDPLAKPSLPCVVQANSIEFFSTIAILWMAVMALMLFRSLQPGRTALSDPPTWRGVLCPLAMCALVATVFTAILDNNAGYGDATLFCWVRSAHADWQLIFFYVPLLVAWVVCLVCVACVRLEIRRRILDAQTRSMKMLAESGVVENHADTRPSAAMLQPSMRGLDPGSARSRGSARQATLNSDALSRMARFLMVFVFFNSFGLINRTTNFCLEKMGKAPYVFPLYALQAALLPLQGFGNACVYGDVHLYVAELIRALCCPRAAVAASGGGGWKWPSLLAHHKPRALSFAPHPAHGVGGSLRDPQTAPGGGPLPLAALPPPPVPCELSVYSATLNLGKNPAPTVQQVRSWLPTGRDVYAISVQECLSLTDMTRALDGALVGYTGHVQSIGSPSVGGHIAIMVYAREELISTDELKQLRTASSAVRRGKKLLPSWMLERAANKGAVGCAFRFHNTTVAFVGCHLASDKGGTSKIDKRVTDTRKMLEGLELAYDTLGFELQQCCHHVVLLGDLNYRIALPAERALRLMEGGQWDELRAADELQNVMARGDVLHDFWEAPLRFVPSYRRVIGEALSADDTRAALSERAGGVARAALDRAFTIFVKKGERTPSYTDRVLCCSLRDLRSQLTCERYTCHEELTVSDHRPVGADLTLRTWRATSGADGDDVEGAGARSHSVRCRISINGLDAALTTAAANGGKDAPETLRIAFPMPAEDPSFSLNRVAWLLGHASLSALECTTWQEALDNGLVATAELECGQRVGSLTGRLSAQFGVQAQQRG